MSINLIKFPSYLPLFCHSNHLLYKVILWDEGFFSSSFFWRYGDNGIGTVYSSYVDYLLQVIFYLIWVFWSLICLQRNVHVQQTGFSKFKVTVIFLRITNRKDGISRIKFNYTATVLEPNPDSLSEMDVRLEYCHLFVGCDFPWICIRENRVHR